MNKSFFILVLLAVLCVSSVTAEWQYQETADSFNNAFDGGGFEAGGGTLIDGLWDGGYSYGNGHYYMNYTKPENSVDSVWQIYDGIQIANVTISVDCFDADENVVQLEVYMEYEMMCPSVVNWNCYNGTGWELLIASDPCTSGNEEGIYWNVTDAPAEPLGYSANYTASDLPNIAIDIFGETGVQMKTYVPLAMLMLIVVGGAGAYYGIKRLWR